MMRRISVLSRGRGFALGMVALLAGSLSSAPASAQTCASSIGSNFNGTSIAGGRFVWFNAVVKVTGRDTSKNTTLAFDSSQIAFSAGGTNYSLDVPASRLEFLPAVTQAVTYYDAAEDVWVTRLPASYTGNAYLSGLAFKAPAAGIPGGTNPVTWSGRFTSATPGLKVAWQWAAAVYTTFSSLSDDLLVKPVDTKVGVYQNSDHAGTPEAFKSYVVGGARGGGGSNYTGSYSGTASATPCVNARQLVLTKAFTPDTQWLDYDNSFAIQVTNNGPSHAGTVVITDTLDPMLLSASAYLEAGNGACTVSGQALTCNLSSLLVGETAVVRVSYHLRYLTVGVPVSLVNCARAVDSDGNTAQGCATLRYIYGPG